MRRKKTYVHQDNHHYQTTEDEFADEVVKKTRHIEKITEPIEHPILKNIDAYVLFLLIGAVEVLLYPNFKTF